MRWDDYRHDLVWDTPVHSGPGPAGPGGRGVGRYPVVHSGALAAQVLQVPAGYGDDTLHSTGDLVLVGLRGELAVRVGGAHHRLAARDVLLLPAGTSYGCLNLESSAAFVFTITPAAAGSALAPPQSPVDSRGAGDGRGTGEGRGGVVHQPWEQARREFEWRLPFADRWGNHRAAGPHVSTPSIRGHWALQPVGQRCRWHSWPADVVYCGQSGEIVFHTSGQRLAVGPLDLLVMPAAVPYLYVNSGLADCLFYDVGGNVAAGTKSIYFQDDPGWPVDPAAPLLANP